ncbi:2-hydroxyhepta-2,4-diene-1,7-dioate isomerase [Thermobispora bispora]|uniref:fumarylacetoacetate hydrolase family protein n=1 Tax=Thermobispora bispora TaxID=2006 RepID=UPI0030E977E6
MKLATLRTPTGTAAVRVEDGKLVELGYRDVGELLRRGELSAAATMNGREYPLAGSDLAPVIPEPGKIVCVGLNYRTHILEMGRQLPEHPTLFAKYADALVGPYDDIALPPESGAVDWEGELALIIGATVRRARGETARAAIAGYTVMNDVTMRDFQYRTSQWLQGKTWEASTPLGPYLVTPEELSQDAWLRTFVDDVEVQAAPIADLVFDPVALVEYVSTITTLRPGDIIATGTPGGVGHARKPSTYLRAGATVRTRIDGVGEIVNRIVPETT